MSYLKREGMRAINPELPKALEEYNKKIADQKKKPHPLAGVKPADLKAALAELGYKTQKDIAELLGISQASVSNKLKNPALITIEEYAKISEKIHIKDETLQTEWLDALDGYGTGEPSEDDIKEAVERLRAFEKKVLEKIGYDALRGDVNKTCWAELQYRVAIEALNMMEESERNYFFETLALIFRNKSDKNSKVIYAATRTLKAPWSIPLSCEHALIRIIESHSLYNTEQYYSHDVAPGGNEGGDIYYYPDTGEYFTLDEWREEVLKEYCSNAL